MKEQIGDLEAELRRGNILEKELESLRKEKSQAEAAYTKYKEVQELLLNQQKQITLQEKRNSSHDMKDSIEGNRQFFLWMIAGFGIVAAGIFFLINFKEIFADYKGIGYGLFFFGLLIFAIALVRMKRQKPVCDCAKEQYDKQIAESIKKDRKEQTDTSLECQIEETQQRLRKIQIMIENTYKKIVHLEQRIKELTRKKEQLLEKEEQAACLREQYASEYLKYERLNMTKTYLTKARESYLAKYRSPLMQSFSKYYEMVSGEKAQDIRMDVNLNLTVQDLGIQREARYYSEGWKDLMGICMRMALVDVMYQKEKPFMILDDPFVNLDEEKGKSALAFLKELGKEYQILYFTCHKSRRMDV